MKRVNIFVASDIHGSAYWCEKMLRAFEREGAERLLLLGDILYHGPRNDLPEGYAPKEVAEMLNGIREKILCVRGNCDTEVDQMVLKFPIMADCCLLFDGGMTVFATHGHIYNTENMPPLCRGDILLHGHTHVPAMEKAGGVLYLNPGSVSIPKDGSRNGYMTLCDRTFTWKDMEGNAVRTCEYKSEK